MYESYYGFHEKPFSLLPDPSFLYLGKNHKLALSMFQYGIANQAGITVITGEIGCGKTTLIRHMLDQMDRDITVGLITNTHSSFGDLLQWVLLAFDLEFRDMEHVERYQAFMDFLISEYAQNRHTVLIVDEAQNMDAATIEELRMLSNVNADKHQVLQLVLVGQPQLRATLRRPDLRQFAQRVSVDYHLEPLDEKHTREYIRHRVKCAGGEPSIFQSDAYELIHKYSKGIPRTINMLCDTALVYAFGAKKKRLNGPIIDEVASDKSRYGLFEMPAESETEISDPEAQSGRTSSVTEIRSAQALTIDKSRNKKRRTPHDKGTEKKSRHAVNQREPIRIGIESDDDPQTKELKKPASFKAEERVDPEFTIPSLQDELDRCAPPSTIGDNSTTEIGLPISTEDAVQDGRKAPSEAEETRGPDKHDLRTLSTRKNDDTQESALPTFTEEADQKATLSGLGNEDTQEVTPLTADGDVAGVSSTLTFPRWLQVSGESQGVSSEQQTPASEESTEEAESKNVRENSPPRLGILRWLRPAK